MSEARTAAAPALSTRLVQVLRTYCVGLEVRALQDLRDSVTAGRYSWLPDELRAALAGDAFNPDEWALIVGGTPEGHEPPPELVRRQQHQVWNALFPGDPFPGNPPSGA